MAGADGDIRPGVSLHINKTLKHTLQGQWLPQSDLNGRHLINSQVL